MELYTWNNTVDQKCTEEINPMGIQYTEVVIMYMRVET